MNVRYSFTQNIVRTGLPSLVFCMLSINAPAAETSTGQQELRQHYNQLLTARAEFEQSLSNGALNQTEQADFRAWIQQLDTQVLLDCQLLSPTEARQLPADLPCDQIKQQSIMPANIDIQAEQTRPEKTASIVDQLSSSLGTFDEQLLQEQQRIKANMPRTESEASSAGASGASGASGTEGTQSNSQSASTNPPTNATQSPSEADKSQTDKQTTKTSGSSGSPGAPGSAAPGGNARQSTPDDIPDGSDDDVVARQLREAAEKEQDPELKKKLWEEYRHYKAGIN